MAKNAKPVHTVRIGRIKAAIWANETQGATIHNVTITRSYRVEDGWKDTSSFGRDDLLTLAKVLDQAHTWIIEHERDAE